jgi:hypothetical protein
MGEVFLPHPVHGFEESTINNNNNNNKNCIMRSFITFTLCQVQLE